LRAFTKRNHVRKQKTTSIMRIELLITRLNQNHLPWRDSSSVFIWLCTFVLLLQSLWRPLNRDEKLFGLRTMKVSWLVLRHPMNEPEWHAWSSDHSWPISVENLHTTDHSELYLPRLRFSGFSFLDRIWLQSIWRFLQVFVSKRGKNIWKNCQAATV